MSAPSADSYDMLYAKLNQETARLPWRELLRHFASGSVIVVSDGMDLIEVAARMATDDAKAMAAWLENGSVARATDDQAQAWLAADLDMWTVVVKPWVLVQQRKEPAAKSLH